MIWPAALTLALVADDPDRSSLAQCLAYLSRAPEFAPISDDDLASSEAFYDAAQGSYCADEASQFWPVAHRKARAALGVTHTGTPIAGQQHLARQEMRTIFRDVWIEARSMRARGATLPRSRMSKFVLTWLLNNPAAEDGVLENKLLCARDAIRKSKSVSPADIGAGPSNPAYRKATEGCAIEELQQESIVKVRARFPDIDADLAASVTSFYLGQMTFWAALSR